MKIAYKALHYQVLCEKEELLYQVDKLVEENIKMRDEVELYGVIAVATLIICAISTILLFWVTK